MNERFALDPESCNSALELKYLLEKFGPYTGRYGVQFPRDWHERVRAHMAGWPDVERARATVVLRRAHYSVLRENLAYKREWAWLKNVEHHLVRPRLVDGVVVRSEWEDVSCSFLAVHNLDLPPTADEKIFAKVSEYERVSRGLRSISPELIFLDPYLNIHEPSQRSVVEALLSEACRNASFWVKPGEGRDSSDIPEILSSIKKSRRISGAVRFLSVEDWPSEERRHARYLLSVRGAIRFDEGFRERRHSKGYKKVDISVVGKSTHDDLCRRYLEGGHGLRIVSQYVV